MIKMVFPPVKNRDIYSLGMGKVTPVNQSLTISFLHNERIIFLRYLPHGYPEMTSPHVFVCNELEIWDERFELK